MDDDEVKECFYCSEESGQLGTCPRCEESMTRGILLIAVADGETGQQPRRTGGLVLVPDAILRPALAPEAFAAAQRRRAAFVPTAAWKLLGLDYPEGRGTCAMEGLGT